MCANAVVFSQPVAKFYSVLPPPRADMDECLAVLFTGPAKPTVADFKRTPLLLRHNAVRNALLWLKLNHVDYADLVISERNLATYSEDSPPVCVIHRPSDGSENAESLSVNDSDGERGTESGPCPFVVHGLTGGELVTMSYEARIHAAVDVLAYGHSSQPDSIYHNPTLYPTLFPWLYPYGLGGFDNELISTHIDRGAHIKQLLMYADRRFQTDERRVVEVTS
ncbi:hypothetical protein B0H21DRAFT_781396 [Amylocystis lapponica]|nr:hypothetical protein B0H21DRAFT_781396 [Amylocystis lapponica]